MKENESLIKAMFAYDRGMAKQIQHFLKVYEFAHLIGNDEGLDEKTQFILETAAIVHDIGIRSSLARYGDSDGKHQEQLGPDEARGLLQRLDYEPEVIDRVCFLIGHHHTYSGISGLDYQILVEADFLVNLYEDEASEAAVGKAYQMVFRTKTGKQFLREIFGLEDDTKG